MKYDDLSAESKGYIDRYINNTAKTREEALEEALVQGVIREYESGMNKKVCDGLAN